MTAVMIAAMPMLMIAIASALQPAQPPAEAAPTTIALVETYADGRTNYELVSARPAKMWWRPAGLCRPDRARPHRARHQGHGVGAARIVGRPGSSTRRRADHAGFSHRRRRADEVRHRTDLIEANAGRRVQLERIIDALRQTLSAAGSGDDRLAALRARIDALPASEPDQLAGAQ